MKFINDINLITIVIIGLFVIPIVIGIISRFSSYRIQRSFASLLRSVVFLVSIILAIYLTDTLLKDTESPLLTKLYTVIPSLRSLITSNAAWVYFGSAVVMTAVIGGCLHLLTIPVYKFVVVPLTKKIWTALNKKNGATKRIFGGLWEVPKSVIWVIVFSLLLNFWSGYNSDAIIEKAISTSTAYQFVEKNILNPILSSDIAEKIPVLLRNSFEEAATTLVARDTYLIQYFNGMTLDDAVKSNEAIDSTAIKIVGNETDEKEKAKLIYGWIISNITYDNEKAVAVAADSGSVSSGAIIAYTTKTGICFDYACLFVAMCRAVNVKVRFVTGLGYSGTEWGDHAWNQTYVPTENSWVNIDTTFGSSGINYFDRSSFGEDHQFDVIQAEW